MTNLQHILDSLIYAGIGIAVLVFAFVLIDKLTPHNLWKEVIVEKNIAVAILAAGFMLGLAIIISSAIRG
jgi:putative membrane protein